MTYALDNQATGWTYAAGTSDASAWTAQYPTSAQTKVTDPNNHTATYALDSAANSVTKITDANGHHTDTVFDTHDNEQSTTTTLGNKTGYTWTSSNMLNKATSPASSSGSGSSTTYNYPTGGSANSLSTYQPSSVLDSQGNTTTPQYDGNSDVSSVLTPINTDGTRAGGTPTSHRQGDDDHTSCSAFTGELCSASNGDAKTTSYGYDALGRVTTRTQPAPLKPLQFTYDGASRLTSATDGRGNTAYYSYDANDRLTQVSYSATGCPAATCVAYSYDGVGNKLSRTGATGATGYTYDRLNRPTTKTFNGSTVSAVTWDGASNMLSFTDAAGTVTYRYDPANQLSFLAEPGGSCSTSSYASPNSTKCTHFTYTDDNQGEWVYYPNGQIHLQYTPAGQLKQLDAATSGGGVLASRGYTYSKGGAGRPITLSGRGEVEVQSRAGGRSGRVEVWTCHQRRAVDVSTVNWRKYARVARASVVAASL